jgi:hypothetical protein
VVGVKVTQYDVSRWPEPPTIVTDSVISAEGIWYFYPALTVDSFHNVAVGMNRSSRDEFGSLWVSGRLVGDPPGQFRPPTPVKRGLANKQASVVPRPTPLAYSSRTSRARPWTRLTAPYGLWASMQRAGARGAHGLATSDGAS